MGTLFALLVGMLVAGAGVAIGIVARDRSNGQAEFGARCSADE